MDLRLLLLGGSALAAFAAGWSANGWRIGLDLEAERAAHAATRETYQARLAEAMAEAMDERARLAAAARGVIRERNDEVEALRAAAGRVPDVVRVRVPADCTSLPPTSGDLPGGAGDDSGSTAGELPSGVGGDHSGVELDLRRATALIRRADEVAADLRAVLEICRSP